MGVKELVLRLREFVEQIAPEHYSSIFLTNTAKLADCGVSISEILLKFFEHASTKEPMTIRRLFELLLAEYVALVRNSGMHELTVVGDDARYVPYAKLAEQMQRIYGRSVAPYEECWTIEFPVREVKDPVTGAIRVHYSDGAMHNLNNPKFPNRLDLMEPQRFVTTRRFREAMMDGLFLFAKYHTWPLNRRFQIYWDMGSQDVQRIWYEYRRAIDPDTGLSGILCIPHSEAVPSLNNGIGEGELKAVWWLVRGTLMRRLAAHRKRLRQTVDFAELGTPWKCREGRGIHLKTKDQDVLPVLMNELVAGPMSSQPGQSAELESLGPIYWQNSKDTLIDVWKLVRCMLRSGWDVPRFTLACAMSGTDYTTKKLTSFSIGGQNMWVIWRNALKTLPTFPLVQWDDKAGEVASVLRSMNASAMLVCFDSMVRALYSSYVVAGSAVLSWERILGIHRSDGFRSWRLAPKGPATTDFQTAWVEVCYLWMYTQSLGRCQSDILCYRGLRNEQSRDAVVLGAVLLVDPSTNCVSTLPPSSLAAQASTLAPKPSPARPLRTTALVSAVAADGDLDAEIGEAIADLQPMPLSKALVFDPPDSKTKTTTQTPTNVYQINRMIDACRAEAGHTVELFRSYMQSCTNSEDRTNVIAYRRFLARHAPAPVARKPATTAATTTMTADGAFVYRRPGWSPPLAVETKTPTVRMVGQKRARLQSVAEDESEAGRIARAQRRRIQERVVTPAPTAKSARVLQLSLSPVGSPTKPAAASPAPLPPPPPPPSAPAQTPWMKKGSVAKGLYDATVVTLPILPRSAPRRLVLTDASARPADPSLPILPHHPPVRLQAVRYASEPEPAPFPAPALAADDIMLVDAMSGWL